MNCSTPGLPVHHQLLEFTQTHVHQVSDAIQPSHPPLAPSPPAPNPSQHQGLFQWVHSSHEVAKVQDFQLQHQSYRTLQNTGSQDRCTQLFTLSGLRCVRVLSRLRCVQLFANLWTVALQAPLSKEFSRQEHCSRLPCPPPGGLSNPEIKPVSLMSPGSRQVNLFSSVPVWKGHFFPLIFWDHW